MHCSPLQSPIPCPLLRIEWVLIIQKVGTLPQIATTPDSICRLKSGFCFLSGNVVHHQTSCLPEGDAPSLCLVPENTIYGTAVKNQHIQRRLQCLYIIPTHIGTGVLQQPGAQRRIICDRCRLAHRNSGCHIAVIYALHLTPASPCADSASEDIGGCTRASRQERLLHTSCCWPW